MPHVLLTFLAVLLASLSLAPPAHAAWTWPLRGEVITPYRNGDDPYAGGQHRGIDIAGTVGAPVLAAAAGEVRFAGTAGSSGLTVSVRTADGFDTSYLHLSSTSVRAGERVVAGDRLGAVGTSGTRSAAQPHLHFGVREAGSEHAYRDPLAFLPPPPVAARPAPEPAPAPQPILLTPAPQPAPAGRGAPAGGRVPVPGGAPAPRDAPVPRGLPAPRGAPVPRRVPEPRTAPDTRGQPAPRLGPVPAGAPSPLTAPLSRPTPAQGPVGHGVEGRPAPAGLPAPGDAAASRPELADGRAGLGSGDADQSPSAATSAGEPAATAGRGPAAAVAARGPASGPDLGMLLACAGLLLAAALLGGTGEGRKTARAGGGRALRVLRPLLGRGLRFEG
ncbi:MAG TPA: peptidoglycan DD-metalloendopeptidase family protein [Thermoleophilaceae bacterium]|nr:peptidoglycan DD-metalloendopeptidase family protein [Thermoleophilaceae bacterium]